MSILHFARDTDCIMPAEVAQRVIAGTITAPRKRPASVWRRHRVWIEPVAEAAAGAVLAVVALAFLIAVYR